eukprot:CAMPEP_0203812228 /NCGR_PEP_ID=MMETSP0115-20131106/4032_1 /ASSEMBLY_ACC=CAM_ASM_000227 /TAXON_ID=33651 /ORGANISM="Bicosoecid sp, Strain ms1" /LENGTH=560 /DNA_ID=CAMNT_0050721069 /DNA_START=73 /DNA_END=1752 /DNA_ORIENTATION=-
MSPLPLALPLALALVLLSSAAAPARARVWDLEADGGAVAGDDTLATQQRNGAAMNATLAKLRPGDEFLVPAGKRFFMMGGVQAAGLTSVTLRFEGSLVASDDMKAWPRHGDGQKARVFEFIELRGLVNVTLTSSSAPGLNGGSTGDDGRGVIDGRGSTWWGFPGIGYLEIGENRPRLLVLDGAKDVVVENLFLKDSPYWTFWAPNADGLEIRNSRVEAYRLSNTSHDIIDLTAFNTDGFDVTGNDIWIHHSTVFNQDDCFCIKDDSTNVVVEHVNASGLGLTIGSIASNVNNVTFRNAHMRDTVKGVYLKFRGNGVISNVLFENIVIDEPTQYPIWIGPAQQSDDQTNPCAAHPCSLCWPLFSWAECNAPPQATYINITLRNVVVNSPAGNVGVILANTSSPMQNVVFDGVVVNNPSTKPAKWGTGYLCEGVASGVATGGTTPVPSCFKDDTDAARARRRREAARAADGGGDGDDGDAAAQEGEAAKGEGDAEAGAGAGAGSGDAAMEDADGDEADEPAKAKPVKQPATRTTTLEDLEALLEESLTLRVIPDQEANLKAL